MKKINILIFLSTSLLVVLSFALFMIIKDYNAKHVSTEKPLVFEDKVFESSLKKTLSKKDKDSVYQSELASYVGIVIAANQIFLVSPTITEKNVVLYSGEKFEIDTTMYTQEGTMTSLADLKYFPNLTNLKIYFQKKVDYNTIGISATINNLSLYADDIVDITFVSKFINLGYINFTYNKIENLTPLQDLVKLKVATINYNNITNLMGIEKVTSLTNLQMNDNKISDISLLPSLINLTYLSLQNNNILDVSPIANLTNLENLFIKENPIANMDSLNTLKIIPE